AEYFFRVCDHMCGRNGAIAGAGFRYNMAAILRADDGATQRHDSINAYTVEDDVITGRKYPVKSVAKTNDTPAELVAGEHNSAQYSVESMTRATAGQTTNPLQHHT